ncbi:hypothetical protein [Burkholderia territorii]|uniref:hypothetical protein n=1 Tax=Burkholderia territorii TaxID=1503055 RepID=UPI0012DAE71E|nr:hypothetical protein [Burkholderia territorii]
MQFASDRQSPRSPRFPFIGRRRHFIFPQAKHALKHGPDGISLPNPGNRFDFATSPLPYKKYEPAASHEIDFVILARDALNTKKRGVD